MARSQHRGGGFLLALAAFAPCCLVPQAACADATTPIAAPRVAIAQLHEDAARNTLPDALNRHFRARGTVSAGNAALQTQNYRLLIQDDSGGISRFARGRRFPDLDPGIE